MVRILWLGLFASSLLIHMGCRNTGERRPLCGGSSPPTNPVFVAPPTPMPIAQPPLGGPPPNASYLPPSAVYTPPEAKVTPPPQEPPVMKPLPGAGGPTKVETQWQPTEAREPAPRVDVTREAPRFELYAPEPLDKDKDKAKDKAKDSFYLGPPQTDKDKQQSVEPPPLKKPSVQATFPAIPQFAVAKDNVYAGLRPPLDGLDWLQTNGVKAVVHLRLPGEDDSPDRKQIEKRNLRYVALEVSPQTLTKAKVDEFIKLIRAGSKESIFVYDQDGSLAGALWYLYFRQGEFMDDDAAQLRARPLGLQTNRDGSHRDMWLAVQKFLEP